LNSLLKKICILSKTASITQSTTSSAKKINRINMKVECTYKDNHKVHS
jgi:hypothetical protein